MRPSVEQQLRSRPVDQNDLLVFVNRELMPWARQTRAVTNMMFQGRAQLPTSGTGVFTALYTSPDLAVGKTWLIDATVMAYTDTQRSAWIIRGLFYNQGTVTQEGVTTAVYTQTAAAFAVQFAVVSNHVEVQVQDDGALSPTWQVWIEMRENPQ